eukprot:scaffold1531_cov111-Isochrysis_galbana.AAC.10
MHALRRRVGRMRLCNACASASCRCESACASLRLFVEAAMLASIHGHSSNCSARRSSRFTDTRYASTALSRGSARVLEEAACASRPMTWRMSSSRLVSKRASASRTRAKTAAPPSTEAASPAADARAHAAAMAETRSGVAPSMPACAASADSIRSSAGRRGSCRAPLGKSISSSQADPSRGEKPYNSKNRRDE